MFHSDTMTVQRLCTAYRVNVKIFAVEIFLLYSRAPLNHEYIYSPWNAQHIRLAWHRFWWERLSMDFCHYFQPVSRDNLPDPMQGTTFLNNPEAGHRGSQQAGARSGSCAIIEEASHWQSCLLSPQPPSRVLTRHYHPMLHWSSIHEAQPYQLST